MEPGDRREEKLVHSLSFSHVRENILSWLPFTGKENVLEIGSGCGAITGALCKKAEKVTCN